MKIAFIGIRGIPVIYSGFESFAETLAEELVKKDFAITVYCRNRYVDKNINSHKGVTLVRLPAPASKNLESIFHSAIATVHTILFSRPDIIYYFGVGNAIFTLLPRLFGIRTIINVDGFDWRREKWGVIAKTYLFVSQYLATILPNVTITDSKYMQAHYIKYYRKKTVYLPYPFDRELVKLAGKNTTALKKFKLQKRKYFVWVGRFVPDNHLEDLINAFKKLKTRFKCVIVGDDLIESDYSRSIRKMTGKDKRFVFTGFIGKGEYAAIVKNSFCYVETKRSGGTHPSFIEAMGLGTLILCNDFEPNRMIMGEGAVYYSQGKLDRRMEEILQNKFAKMGKTIKKESEKTVSAYALSKINSEYIELFHGL